MPDLTSPPPDAVADEPEEHDGAESELTSADLADAAAANPLPDDADAADDA